jgi:hypothetical protein
MRNYAYVSAKQQAADSWQNQCASGVVLTDTVKDFPELRTSIWNCTYGDIKDNIK